MANALRSGSAFAIGNKQGYLLFRCPAVGQVNGGTGGRYDVPGSGIMDSGTPATAVGRHAFHFTLNNDNVRTANYSRAFAYTLRCVQGLRLLDCGFSPEASA